MFAAGFPTSFNAPGAFPVSFKPVAPAPSGNVIPMTLANGPAPLPSFGGGLFGAPLGGQPPAGIQLGGVIQPRMSPVMMNPNNMFSQFPTFGAPSPFQANTLSLNGMNFVGGPIRVQPPNFGGGVYSVYTGGRPAYSGPGGVGAYGTQSMPETYMTGSGAYIGGRVNVW